LRRTAPGQGAPITIVIMMTMLTFLIGTMDLASRLGVCITALISAVVLHSDSTSELPTVGYRVAGQCSALQGGGEGPRWEGRQARAVPQTGWFCCSMY